jgi:hypothetical protein
MGRLLAAPLSGLSLVSMTQGLPLRIRFERFECKYLLTEAQAHALRRYVAPYVEADPHARGRPDNRYRIATLYLDTPDLRLHRETIEGLRNRYTSRSSGASTRSSRNNAVRHGAPTFRTC